MIKLGNALRKHGSRISTAPPSVLQCWLDAPQLLSPTGTRIALDLLGRRQPGILVRRYLHRVIAASSEEHADIVMGELWRELAAAEPLEILLVASRWIAFDFGRCAFLNLVLQALVEHVRGQAALIEAIDKRLLPTPNASADAIKIARELLVELRNLTAEG